VSPQVLTDSCVFREEAEKLFVAEATTETLPAVAGCALLYMAFAMHGDVSAGLRYLNAAVMSAEKMKLFEEPSSTDPVSLQTLITMSKAAWGIFNMYV
jgi:hypothetical protein